MSLADKLRELDQLHAAGLIDTTEHQGRRRHLLDIWEKRANPNMEGADLSLSLDQEIGPQDNRFRLVRQLGGGGMGQVWLARDLAEEELIGGIRHKAIKVVHPEMLRRNPEAADDLKREVIRARELHHPHIIRVYQWLHGEDGWALAVMEYLEGLTLRQRLRDQGNQGLPLEEVLDYLQPMVQALDYAHAQRIVHRDIKPDNVMLDKHGVVKLVDFGLSSELRRTASITGLEEALPGGWTPEYVAPEVARFNPIPAVHHDVYSLACMAWELLVGQPPFTAAMVFHRTDYHRLERPATMSVPFYRALCTGFAYEPTERPNSAGAWFKLLLDAQAPPPPTVQLIHGWGIAAVQGLQKDAAAALGMTVCFRDALADGSLGPEMQVIPAGCFLMGSAEDEVGRFEDERQHEVVIAEPFALGRYAISFHWYERFCNAVNSSYPNDEGWGRDSHPVINVSWHHAHAFCQWLSEQTGQTYRLPTEAEWEYACRAGTTTGFWWGEEISTAWVNFDGSDTFHEGCRGRCRGRTLPVDAFGPNPWGLKQMHGNTLEYTASRYATDYDGAELIALNTGHSANRVFRGGAWLSDAHNCRAAFRGYGSPDNRYFYLGFRVARSL